MAMKMLCAATLLGGASASTRAGVATTQGMLGVVESFSLSLKEDAPEWCKNETELTWKQRKERMQQHATLQWAKKQAKSLRDENKTMPEWMEKIVTDDENRGKLKWAVSESKRLKAEGKEVPEWMRELVKEDERWGNRWAACKAHELKTLQEEVPAWMLDNARKGIMEYAEEKAAEISEQIVEVEEEKEKDDAIVQANGDIEAANHQLLYRAKQNKHMTTASQLNVLEAAMDRFNEAEEEAETGKIKFRQLKQIGTKAQKATATLSALLERKLAAVQSGLDSGMA
jgi:hypothetical protein